VFLQDKQAQEAFKAEIRNRLMSTGRIRGVPRQRKTPPTGLVSYGMAAPEFEMPTVPGPGPNSADPFRLPHFNGAGPYPFQPSFAGDPGLVSPFGKYIPNTTPPRVNSVIQGADRW
jgi:hypothetical protein